MATYPVEDAGAARSTPDWSRALTLTERRDLLGASGSPEPQPEPADPEALVRRHQFWSPSPIHRSPEDLQGRLAVDGISLAAYEAISRGVPMPADAPQRWPWVAYLDAICRDWTALQGLPVPSLEDEQAAIGALAAVVRPFRAATLRDLRGDLDELRAQDPHGILADDHLAVQLLTGFEPQLREVTYSPTVLELHVVRHENGLADTDLPKAARMLQERMESGSGIAFLAEYPVMARTLAEVALQERRNAIDLARRVRDDAALLAERFAPHGRLGRLVEVSEPWGDAHQGGRTVRALRFSVGVRVLYKPRPLKIDVFVAEFLRWLNSRDIEATQRPVLAVDRGSYGWTEVIEPAPCMSLDAVRRFYRRQGGLVAVCHLLAAKDVHFENVIAEGEYPVVVDLEGFLQPLMPRDEQAAAFTGGAMEVFESGLLPCGMAEVGGQYTDFDGSGMAGAGGALPVKVMRLTSMEEGLRFEKVQAQLKAQPNLPVLDGQPLPPRRFAGEVVEGFREVAGTVLQASGELTRRGGLLERAAGLPIRVFLRPSNLYGRVVMGSVHVDLQRDALDRERLLDRLWPGPGGPALHRAVFPHERRQLLALDVPMFVSTSDGVEIRTPDGDGVGVPSLRSGLAVSRQRIDELDSERIDRLARAVRAGIAATARQGDDPRWPALVSHPQRFVGVPVEALRRRAGEIAGTVARDVERGPQGTTWAGLAPVGDRGWSFGPVGLDLYGGAAGIVLFLAYAGGCLGDERLTRRAREGLDMIRRSWEQRCDDGSPAGVAEGSLGGAFGELGGTVFTLTHLSVLWGREDLASEARELCHVVAKRLDEVRECDVIGGVAGTLAVVLTLHEALADRRLLQLATRCGELLAARAEARAGGAAWPTGDGAYLAGFAHGVAGIVGSLARLARVTGERRWADLAAQGRAFEDSLFSPARGNWRDARGGGPGEEQQQTYPVFWCHGAPGVALSRAMMSGGQDGDVARDLRVAVRTTAGARVHHTHCLCHGSLGNLLVLRRCGSVDGDAVEAQVGPLAAAVLETIDQHGVVCGIPDGVPTPGLMMGVSGIGYALLALADPSLPTLLGLDDLPA